MKVLPLALAFICLILAAMPCQAVVTFVQVKGNSSSSAASLATTFTSATTTGNFVVVAVAVFEGTAINSVTDNKSNTYTADFNVVLATRRIAVFSSPNITGGASHSVTVALASVSEITVAIHEYSGVATTASLDQTKTNDNASSTTWTSTATATTTQADELLFGIAYDPFSSTTTYAAGASYTARITQTNPSGDTLFTEDRVVAATGAYVADGTSSPAAPTKAGIVTYKAAGGAAAQAPLRRRQLLE